MKINFNTISLFLAAALMIGCSKREKVPLEGLTGDIVFDKTDSIGTYADQFLNNIYSHLPTGFNRIGDAFLDAATDDAVSSLRNSDIEILGKAMQSPSLTIDEAFSENYTGIRKVNLYLSKIDAVPITNALKTYNKAEARFLRAMFYFELVKRYGGVPLIGDKVLELDSDLNTPRASFDQCVQYIVAECDAVRPLLRKEPLPTNFVGRATEGAALALKSRILLYAASPLNNPGNDTAKWQAAMDAAKAVTDLGYYALLGNFINLFIQQRNLTSGALSNKEVILAFQMAQSQVIEANNAPPGYSNTNASAGLMSPTQELVDAFPMRNGRAIDDPASGYDPNAPYNNRDQRLAFTIFYNGSRWLARNVETFTGGLDMPGGLITTSRTGYYLRKFMGNFAEAGNYSNVDHNFIIFRYAEILLNYAEAANELGLTDIAYTQLKAIRARVGITAGTGSMYGLKTGMNKNEMREAIMLERRLELAFEEHRFWDARRWKKAETWFNKTLHGMRITKLSETTFQYTPFEAGYVAFKAPQMYLYPFNYREIQRNTGLTQNPGW